MTINAFDMTSQLTGTIIREAQAAGMTACGRYISGGGDWKHLTQAEVTLCAADKFSLWLIDEGTGSLTQFEGGETAGAEAGKAAAAVATAFGAPGGTPIFVGVDFAADASAVPAIKAYMSGYQRGCLPYRAGLYADGLVASAVPSAVGDFVPGASGWPGTAAYLTSGKVALIQHMSVTQFGVSIDQVELIDPGVLWSPGGIAVPVPTPTPTPVVNPMPALSAAQAFLGATVDGIWGPQTAAAFEAYYRENP
jgi:hypothetical protein